MASAQSPSRGVTCWTPRAFTFRAEIRRVASVTARLLRSDWSVEYQLTVLYGDLLARVVIHAYHALLAFQAVAYVVANDFFRGVVDRFAALFGCLLYTSRCV